MDRGDFPVRHARVQRHSPGIELARREQQRHKLQPVFTDQHHAIAGLDAERSHQVHGLAGSLPKRAVAQHPAIDAERRAIGEFGRAIANDMAEPRGHRVQQGRGITA